MQRNAKKCWEMQRNVVRQTGIILAKIRALDGRNYGRNSNFILNFNFLTSSQSSVDAIDSWIANSWIAQFTNTARRVSQNCKMSKTSATGPTGPTVPTVSSVPTDRANSRVILPPMAYIDGKSEIISHWPTALCVFFFREVSIGKFAKMSTLPFIFTLTF